jgi:hypothetical protein
MELEELEQFLDVDSATVAGALTWGQAKGAGAGALIGFFGGFYLGLGGASIMLVLSLAVLGGALRTVIAGVPLWRHVWHRLAYVLRARLHQAPAAMPVEHRATPARSFEILQDDSIAWSVWYPTGDDRP